MLARSCAVISLSFLSSLACKTISPQSQLRSQSSSYCESLGLSSQPFQPSSSSPGLGTIAPDFELPTTEGVFQFSREFSGCDSYLIVQDIPEQVKEYRTSLWQSDVPALIAALPRNTHVFFVSVASEEGVRKRSLQQLQSGLDAAYQTMNAEQQAHWRKHLHIVPESVTALKGWVGDMLRNPGWGIGVDRQQRIRYVGSYGDPDRYLVQKDDFGVNLAMLANEAIYYNYEAQREETLARYETKVIPVFRGEVAAEHKPDSIVYADVVLPSPEELSAYDSLELDLTAACPGGEELGACPAWDEALVLYLCQPDKPELCDREFGRWISTYHRLGRWVHDVSPFLPLLKAGGKHRFGFKAGQPYEIHLSLRFGKKGLKERPVQTMVMFQEGFGANFGADYNSKRAPFRQMIPATAKRVELVSVITGHGMQEPGNCAEFCDTTHRFWVNGKSFERSFAIAGSDRGCEGQVASGTVPNQYGTWWYGRSGWCPGRQVDMHRQDVTSMMVLGKENEIRYEGLYRGAVYPGQGAGFLLSAALVIYE